MTLPFVEDFAHIANELKRVRAENERVERVEPEQAQSACTVCGCSAFMSSWCARPDCPDQGQSPDMDDVYCGLSLPWDQSWK